MVQPIFKLPQSDEGSSQHLDTFRAVVPTLSLPFLLATCMSKAKLKIKSKRRVNHQLPF